jgi:hypothetical protein
MTSHADPVEVTVRRTGRTFDANATFDSAAGLELTWRTVTDYPALPQFMPGISACKVVQRERLGPGKERLELEQRGEFRFLVFSQKMTVHLEVLHERQRHAAARALRLELGVLKGRGIETFEGSYDLQRRGSAVRVVYRARIVSRYPPPPGIGTAAVRSNLAEQLNALAGEIRRRASARRTG